MTENIFFKPLSLLSRWAGVFSKIFSVNVTELMFIGWLLRFSVENAWFIKPFLILFSVTGDDVKSGRFPFSTLRSDLDDLLSGTGICRYLVIIAVSKLKEKLMLFLWKKY